MLRFLKLNKKLFRRLSKNRHWDSQLEIQWIQDTLCAWRMYIGMRPWTRSPVHPSGGMLAGGRSENAWRAGAKRRCQPKLERLVRVLFGSHPRGRDIQTVCSISPSRAAAEEWDSRYGSGVEGSTVATT